MQYDDYLIKKNALNSSKNNSGQEILGKYLCNISKNITNTNISKQIYIKWGLNNFVIRKMHCNKYYK